jgi:hypothetical protein
MNKDNMLKVAKAIEDEYVEGFGPFAFDMETYCSGGIGCRTAACVAGTAVLLAHPKIKYRNPDLIYRKARIFLGLTESEADALFLATNSLRGLGCINRARADVPAALTWMVHYDTIDWDKALEAVGARS